MTRKARADGVHLAAKSLPVAAAREVVQRAGGGLVLGCSVQVRPKSMRQTA
ncbi:hypothetical protein [Alicyclobacillus acidocaldarius]|uniref:hypothetical protein n=1 Tax=Alicyclobacillus acidocaldarius TaxID=405212 RepID=UPI00345EE8E9